MSALTALLTENIARKEHANRFSPTTETTPPLALVLEDDEFDAAVTQELLEKFCDKKFRVRRTPALQEAVALLRHSDFGIALLDMNVIDSTGLDTVREIIRANPHVPIVVLTGNDDIETAIATLSLGAQDYLPKSQLDNRTLQRVIEYSIQHKEKETELTSKAYFDSLTGLANRSLLYERWRRSISRSKRADRQTGLLVADIDRFKEVNDRHGHKAGDTLLVHFAERLSKSVRDTDIVARLGGDEFVLVLENIQSREDVVNVRDTLSLTLPAVFSHRATDIEYTVSIGGAISSPRDNEDLMAVIKRADSEMYEFKARTIAPPRMKLIFA